MQSINNELDVEPLKIIFELLAEYYLVEREKSFRMHVLYIDLSKDSLINMWYLLSNIFDGEVCNKDDFLYLNKKILLIFPTKDFFPKESQESLLHLKLNPKVIWIEDGSHGDPMFSEEYIIEVARFFELRFN